MTFSFRKIFDLDFLVIFATIALMIIGILFIYSSGVDSEGVILSNEYVKQIVWCSVGICLMVGFSFFNYKKLSGRALYIFAGFMVLLLYTKFFGRYVNGARSWLGIGDIGIQPSEFAKISFIIYLSYFYVKKTNKITVFSTFVQSLLILIIPVLLILLQPDLGTASVYIPIYLVISFLAGVPFKYLGVLLFGGCMTIFFTVLPIWQQYILKTPVPFIRIFTDLRLSLIIILAFSLITILSLIGKLVYKKKFFFWTAYFSGLVTFSFIFSICAGKILKIYQVMRLIVFLDPNVDPLGSGWNIIQSTTAIGSGGLWGRGFLKGTQSHYRFLPQQSTDFIFSILSEEWGFAGGMLIFGLYAIIIIRSLYIMKKTNDSFGCFIASGIVSMFTYHFIVNIGMAMGIMPITGIPLLFLSYGGSSLWTALCAIALLISINAHRDEFA